MMPNKGQTATGAANLVPYSSASRAVDVVGDYWIQLILYCVYMRVRRFEDFLSATRIARSLLSNRLARLVTIGILRRDQYQYRPSRYEYRLTPMGLDLHAAGLMLVRWERHWHFDPKLSSQKPIHAVCGKEFTPEMVCSSCVRPVNARDTYAVARTHEPAKPNRGLGQRRSIYTVPGATNLHPAIYRAVALMSDRWTSHVVALAFWQVRRFSDFQARLGIATNVLTDRLTRMVEAGIFNKQPYQTRPERYEYRLTDKGRDIFPIILALQEWGDRWLNPADRLPVIVRHRPCESRLVSRVVCDQCQGQVDYRNVQLAGGANDAEVRLMSLAL